MARTSRLEVVERLLKGALLKHAQNVRQLGPRYWAWDAYGSCENPTLVHLNGVPDLRTERFRTSDHGKPLALDMLVRCRHCGPCQWFRRRQASNRASLEVAMAPRTWFVTFTLTPSEQYRIRAEAMAKLDRAGYAPRELTDALLWPYEAKAMGADVTKFLKRLRYRFEGQLIRYIAVPEPHKSGVPHWHLLLHCEYAVKYADICEDWRSRHGIAEAALVRCDVEHPHPDQERVDYVCKYVTKTKGARLRLSQKYGQSDDEWIGRREVFPRALRVLREPLSVTNGRSDLETVV